MASGMPRPIPVGSTCGLAARRTGRGDQATGFKVKNLDRPAMQCEREGRW